MSLPPGIIPLPPGTISLPPVIIFFPPVIIPFPPVIIPFPPVIIFLARAIIPFPRVIIPFPPVIIPFARGIIPFPRGIISLPPVIIPFARGIIPFPRGIISFSSESSPRIPVRALRPNTPADNPSTSKARRQPPPGEATRPRGNAPLWHAKPLPQPRGDGQPVSEEVMLIRLNTPAKNVRSMKVLFLQSLAYNHLPRLRGSYTDPRSVSGVLDGSI